MPIYCSASYLLGSMNKKIRKAISQGDLIPYEKVMKGYSKKEKREILEKARYIQIAIALRNLRKDLRISQEKLAQKMKVKREFVSRIENGEQNVTLETLYKIAEATNKSFYFDFK